MALFYQLNVFYVVSLSIKLRNDFWPVESVIYMLEIR